MAETDPRLDLLLDLEEIKQLKYRYLRTLDTKDWKGFAECFVPEATGDYAGLAFTDRDGLVDYMRTNLAADMVTMHQVHHPEVTVEGDAATGRWYLQDAVLVEAYDFVVQGAAFYDDRYVRTEEGWRVSHTGYQRTFETSHQLSAVPGLVLKVRPTH